MSGSSAFGKTICSICYEDLKPLIEDLQSISICGHVFHELCLQQWLEYCSGPKKCTCPVCKQKCSQDNVGRLYFQSIGDASDVNGSQKPSEGLVLEEGKDPVLLVREVNKLKGKLSAINAAYERQEQTLKEINEELCLCREQLKKETALKNEALKQRTSFQESLQSKSEELVKTSSECSRLQERSMALAKELAALKLVSDMNLNEEEVLKLASFGHGTNSKDTVDVLRKSLVLRNKSYKELMAQCNLLGRGESRSLKKLEKAKEKMKKLKTKLRELELGLEERDNEALRSLKASSRTSGKGVHSNGVKSNTLHITKSPSTSQTEHSAEPVMKSNQSDCLTNHSILFRKTGNIDFHKDLGLNSCKKNKDAIDVDLDKDSHFCADDTCFEFPKPVHEYPSTSLKPQTSNLSSESKTLKKSSVSGTRVNLANKEPFTNGQSGFHNLLSSRIDTENDMANTVIDAVEDDEVHINHPSSAVDGSSSDEIMEIPPFHIRKEVSSPVPTPLLGDQCFTGGLLGPDGSNWHLGKWCKRTQTTISSSGTMQGSNNSTGDLIAVGADGRGGRIKILRSQNHIDVKGGSVLPKKGKNGSKQTSQQPRGCMQIDHFFAKVDRS